MSYPFKINETKVFHYRKHLDFEKIQEHHLYIAATTCQPPSYTSFYAVVVSVKDVNDNKPQFEKALYEEEITENLEPNKKHFIEVVANDKDRRDQNAITYQIVKGNHNDAFEIDASTGKIYQLLELDREDHAEYNLVIEASDNGIPPLKQTSLVKVRPTLLC